MKNNSKKVFKRENISFERKRKAKKWQPNENTKSRTN